MRRRGARRTEGASGQRDAEGRWQGDMAGTTCAYESLAAGMPQTIPACAPDGVRTGSGRNRTAAEPSAARPVPLSPAAREIERGGGARS